MPKRLFPLEHFHKNIHNQGKVFSIVVFLKQLLVLLNDLLLELRIPLFYCKPVYLQLLWNIQKCLARSQVFSRRHSNKFTSLSKGYWIVDSRMQNPILLAPFLEQFVFWQFPEPFSLFNIVISHELSWIVIALEFIAIASSKQLHLNNCKL